MGIRNLLSGWSLQKSHFTCWLIKDLFWCLKFKWLATLMVFPTIFFTVFLLITEKDQRDTNLILSSWVSMNIFWMLHELQGFPMFPVHISMFLGALSIAYSLRKKNT